jgi:hypothetical protein
LLESPSVGPHTAPIAGRRWGGDKYRGFFLPVF